MNTQDKSPHVSKPHQDHVSRARELSQSIRFGGAYGDIQLADLLDGLIEQLEAARGAMGGLMDIAETAMPDSYFITDSRVNVARNWLGSNPANSQDDV